MPLVDYQAFELRPPRKGLVLAITVDSTARPYDLAALDIGNDGAPPNGAGDRPRSVMLWMQAETNDVYFYFDSATSNALDNTAAVAAGAAATYANTYAAVLKAGNVPQAFRINRTTDRWLILKAASTAGVLRIWAASTDSV